jgi:hypothetical protein
MNDYDGWISYSHWGMFKLELVPPIGEGCVRYV